MTRDEGRGTNDEGRETSDERRMTSDEVPRTPEGGQAGKGWWWEVRVARAISGSGGSGGRCEPHEQRMGEVGAVRVVGGGSCESSGGGGGCRRGGGCGRGGNGGLCQSPWTLTKCGDAIIDDCEL